MEGKEAIIKRIIDDAEKKASALASDAAEDAKSRKADAKDWADDYFASQEKLLNRDESDIVTRRLTVADLDVRKIILAEKQKTVSEVLSGAYDRLCGLKKQAYVKLVQTLIEENADEGDGVMLSSDGVLTAEDIKNMKVFGDKKLSVQKELGKFKGGVMLIGKICDKDLTFKALIDNDKENLTAEICKDLFGK